VPNPGLPARVVQAVRDDLASGLYTAAEIMARNGVRSLATYFKYTRDLREAAHAAGAALGPARTSHPAAAARGRGPEPEFPRGRGGEPEFPAAVTRDFSPVQIDVEGWVGVLSDLHNPFHDETAVRAACDEMEAVGIKALLINGDAMDMTAVKFFTLYPDEPTLPAELTSGKKLFRWLRWRFPGVRIVYREGNHEARLRRYVAEKARQLAGIPGLTLPELLGLPELGVEWVQDKRLVRIGRLNTLHGHELSKGGGVNPARYSFLKTTDTVLVGHWHQTSNHTQRTLGGKQISTWSTGCLTDLSPDFMPYGQANHGFALVRVDRDGGFMVRNHRIRDGRVE
jgi:predicted phosphodiesterase